MPEDRKSSWSAEHISYIYIYTHTHTHTHTHSPKGLLGTPILFDPLSPSELP